MGAFQRVSDKNLIGDKKSLAVCPLPSWRDDRWLQGVAQALFQPARQRRTRRLGCFAECPFSTDARIFEESTTHPEWQGMATTLTMAFAVRLLAAANNLGGKDNITAIVAHIKSIVRILHSVVD
jgi:hypothetical protein